MLMGEPGKEAWMVPWKEADRRVRRWGFLDYKLAQAATVFVTLLVAKLVPKVLHIDAGWLVLGALICAAKPALDLFRSPQPAGPPKQHLDPLRRPGP
jgi:hypothetical protein